MDYLPIYVALAGRPVLVVGAGEVAYRKVELLLEAQARVLVIALQLCAEVQALVDKQQVTWLKTDFADEDVDSAVLTIAATNDLALNQRIYAAGLARHRLVNVVDSSALCGFIVPAIVDRSPLQIAISTGGASPVLARQLREKLEQELPASLGAMARLAKKYRPLVKQKVATLPGRRVFWEQLFANPVFEKYVATQQLAEAERLLQSELRRRSAQVVPGHVTLVGAGPGDAGLLTLKGYQALQAADVVLYDALVDSSVLALIRRDAQRIAVGKRAHKSSVPQELTNQWLVDYAQQGLRVVRLKGGDSFVFGRGGEELQALQQAGVSYSVVPGVTAALGATAYAGIPLTHRDHAQSVLFVTGHGQAGNDGLDWASLARQNQTVVIYMGTIKAAEISAQLMAQGKRADTPVAVISQGTLPTQSVRQGVLGELAALAQDAPRPALIVIGDVVSLRESLQWFAQPEQTQKSRLVA